MFQIFLVPRLINPENYTTIRSAVDGSLVYKHSGLPLKYIWLIPEFQLYARLLLQKQGGSILVHIQYIYITYILTQELH